MYLQCSWYKTENKFRSEIEITRENEKGSIYKSYEEYQNRE